MCNEVWERVLYLIALEIAKPSFETWLKPTELIELNQELNQATINAGNEFARDWLESRYKSLLEKQIFNVTNKKNEINVVINESISTDNVIDSLLINYPYLSKSNIHSVPSP
ncbi:DnaA N-terminal domain-containing protein [Bacillus sp. DJP31]|uniref:DnaA N-terminal domain-containing protein n=1 Tax=Bacillus sp. DJP31 TaxID=3409789 RepID=UPI003BB79181